MPSLKDRTPLAELRSSLANLQARCDYCKRFIGEDCLEGHDGTFFGSTPDGDGYTGIYYCAPGKGCNRDA